MGVEVLQPSQKKKKQDVKVRLRRIYSVDKQEHLTSFSKEGTMKEIKFVLYSLLVAAYTSSWWTAARWGEVGEGIFWMILSLATVFLVVLSIVYLVDNWKK